jgi:O-antigen ligase
VTMQASNPARPLAGGLAIVAIGVLVALVTVTALTLVRPVLLILGLCALVLLILTLVVPDRRAYWVFLLVLSMIFDVGKRLTTWIVEPSVVLKESGPPSSGTFSFDVYSTDLVLFAMLLPWLVRLCLRRDHFYMPKIGYLFMLYLAWALIVSVVTAPVVYLSLFEWFRQVFYFVYFICIINNVVTRAQFRAAILALLLGLVIEAGTVISFFEADIGTETTAFAGLYRQDNTQTEAGVTHYESESGEEAHTKRSAGTFIHPAQAAYYLEFTMLVALACLATVPRTRDRLLLGTIFAGGCIAMYLTFSRSGLVGLIFGVIIFFAVARRARLISQRAFAWCVLAFVIFAALSGPLLFRSLIARPQAATYRLELLNDSLETYRRRPVTGSGLAAVVVDARKKVLGKDQVRFRTIHNHYLIVLTETGPLGFLLFFGFFWQIARIAFRSMRAAQAEMKLLLVGIVGALASIAMHNLGDGFGGHTNAAMIWLYAGLIVAIARRVRAERALPAPVLGAAVVR